MSSRSVLVAVLAAASLVAPSPARAAVQGSTLVVTTTADAGPGSLRQALLDANASRGPHTISFAIPGAAPHTIAPASPLPVVTESIAIDATTEPGYVDRPVVEISGANVPGLADGLRFQSGGNAVRALVVNRFGRAGLSFESPPATVGGNVVEGCYLGVTADGTEAPGNGLAGVYVDGVPGTRVGGTERGQGNVVSANGEYGVYVAQADGTSVLGNRIGVGADGALALGNGGAGIRLVRSTRATTIGGVEPGADNVIAHNGGAGFDVDFGIDVTILSNAIFDNGRVDAGLANGITMNVNAMEPPVLTSVTPGRARRR